MAKKPLPVEVAKGKGAKPPPSEGARTDVDDEGRRKPENRDKEAEQVKVWTDRISQAETDNEQWFSKDIPKLRKYVTGEQHNDGAPGLVRTNLIWSTIATNCPHIYAKDPEVEVSLTDAVPKDQYGIYKDFARSLQSVMDSLFTRGGKLKLRAKSAVRSTMTTAVGWCKVIYQCDVRGDPLTGSRINDTQDNIQRVLTLIQQIRKGEELGDETALAAKKLELEEQLASLQSEQEVNTVHGMVIDRVLTEDMLVLDATIKDFDYYIEADALAHRLWVTKDKYQDLFGYVLPEGATPHDKPETKQGETVASQVNPPAGQAKPPSYYAVYEVWHKGSNTVYTVVKGGKTWARMPYQPKNVGARWYPFFALCFNPVDGRWRPMSDVEMLTELQDEYNTTRTNYAEARKSAIPVLVVRTGGDLTEEDIERIKNRKINQIIAVEGTPGTPIANEMAFLPTADIKPEVYDTSGIRADFEQVSGTADAARGNISKVKTATEADILQQGLMSRADERRDVSEDWVGEMAQYSAEILLDALTRPQVARLVGVEAASKWPQLSRDRIFEMVQLRIKAGSAGRPNQQREREQWIQLLPEIQKTIEQVFQLQMAGDSRMARTSIELLKETLERFDEYIDLDRFIPPDMQGDEQDATSKMLQEMMQLKQQLAQMQEELAKTTEEKQKAEQQAQMAQSGAEAKVVAAHENAALEAEKARRADELKAAELRAKTDETRRTNTAKALEQTRQLAFQERLEALKLASAERIELRRLDLQAKEADRQRELDKQLADKATAHDAQKHAAQLNSAEEIAEGKNSSSEKTAKMGNDTTARVAEGKNKTQVSTAKAANDTKTKIASQGGESGGGDSTTQLATALSKLADVLAADSVPVRGPDGKIERVKKDIKPKAKPKK